MYVLLAGLNHRTAPVEVREKLAFSAPVMEKAYHHLKQSAEIEGAVILATCNRTEVYATTRNIANGTAVLNQFLEEFSGFPYHELQGYLYQPTCYDAISHIFRVSSGLDSMILGEAQILAQVKEAYQTAMEKGASDGVLNALFQKAIFVGKKTRTETGIDHHPVSVSYAAVELARQHFDSLEDKTVLVVGAGEMSELATRYLMVNGVKSVIVSNRSFDRAQLMAQSFNGRAVRFDQLPDELYKADIVISCTAANHYVIRADNCGGQLAARQGKEMIIIDIAVPRDVDPVLGQVQGVHIFDIDDLQNVVDSNYLQRQKAARQAEQIIAEELEKFNEWLAGLYVVPVITALKQRAETIKEQELKKAFNRLGKVSDHEQKVIVSMAHTIINQLLHNPIVGLKEMAVSNEGHLYAEVAKKLFGLQVNMGEQADEQTEVGNKG
jgi:glutamyl-tRNA reductase